MPAPRPCPDPVTSAFLPLRLNRSRIPIELFLRLRELISSVVKCLTPRNFNAGVAGSYFEYLERLGRRTADVGAGVGVVDAAVAGAVDAVGLRLILHCASQMRANRGHRNP